MDVHEIGAVEKQVN